jgi:hypothetical protein
MRAAGWKAKWFKPVEAVMQRQAEMAKQVEMAQGVQMLDKGADIAQKGGAALAHGDKTMDASAKAMALIEQLQGGQNEAA